ncbi:NUDIX hydrolase [Nereida sp. MMG025]|uniref:NUDIX hydrolase n=1 Tax=Nereida sp. MMG025 TaxID=2909981 RepID=UPI001F29DB71|nr:NUDIX hydrolase [Nereida sp. MMG025]MCF6445103.1 NUDIX hydrolase [Nereida sp. MMG025]
MSQDVPIRDAATVILVRDVDTTPRILMGQRGAKAAFMPSKFVFPGGAVDAEDARIPLARPIDTLTHNRLMDQSALDPNALAAAAIRELWEETGLILGQRGHWADAPKDWAGFAERGCVPDASPLSYVFRAITPPGRPRRFDARFFLVNAQAVVGDLDDFSAACDELSHLHWVALPEARALDLPFITEVVLAEVAANIGSFAPPASVPFFKNNDEESLFLRLGGTAPSA